MTMLERLARTQNRRDAHRMAALFAVDYDSSQPAHPGRAFTGRAQVLANWSSIFEAVPDFRADVLASAVDGDVEWGEVHWHGTQADGSTFAMRGVLILTVADSLISAARLYVEPVDSGELDITAAVQSLVTPEG